MIARVTLEIALRKEFDYRIPEALDGQVEVGSRVKVPFGHRQVMGCVTDLLEEVSHPNLKDIIRVVGARSLVTPKVMRLARWIGEYYCCPPETALKSVLPDAVRKEQEGWRELLVVRPVPRETPPPKLTARQREIYEAVQERKGVFLRDLLKEFRTTSATVRRLEDHGLVVVAPEIDERDPYADEKFLPTRSLKLNDQQTEALAAVIEAMDDPPGGAGVSPAAPGVPPGASSPSGTVGSDTRGSGVAGGAGCGAEDGVGARERGEVEGDEGLGGTPRPTGGTPVPPHPAGGASRVFLLHGVTGSGKTEVYLQALEHALEQGKGAIVLVPEISLTPQTVERFKARFSEGPNRTLVAVLHSHLSAGERHDEWHKIRQGRARIVIGARSAIFAPVDPLGLVIVDEEHEHSYKQEEAPRYHARDVAVVRGQMEDAVVILGSATPSMESFHNAQTGKYRLLELPHRADHKRMPLVRVVDMRMDSRKAKGGGIFSISLREAILQRLEKAEQTILFLNRRGYATSLQCPKCGYVAECPNCSIALTYHRPEQELRCHICGVRRPAPKVCPEPECRSPGIRYSGLGTQKVEEALNQSFPRARVQRMDSDILKRKDDYRRILGDFRTGKTDILIGTQMIAKGLHFPNVTLVGIIHADLSLHQADFRAGERTFQLITQVAGRAGRGDVEGEVFVQSFTPFHPAIQYARRHDYEGFYEQEIEFREQLRYPPLARVALLTLRGQNDDKVSFCAEQVKRELEKRLPETLDMREVILMGPAPAPLARAEKYYRHQIMLRTRQMKRLSTALASALQQIKLPREIRLAVDIDPVNLG